MTDTARELLEDVALNDVVRILYGFDANQYAAEGTVLKLSENILTLGKADGSKVKIRLDDGLRMVDVLACGGGEAAQAAEPAPAPEPPRPQWKPEPLAAHPETVFSADDQLAQCRAALAQSENRELKRILGGVEASFRDAVKNRKLGDKYHDLRRRLLQSLDACESGEESRAVYRYLGVLACAAEKYGDAQTHFAHGGNYELAAYAARKDGNDRRADILCLCAVLNGEAPIDRLTADSCIALKDASVLQELFEQKREDAAACRQIAACACKMLLAQGGELPAGLSAETAAPDAARLLLEALPAGSGEAMTCWKEYRAFQLPQKKADEPEGPAYFTGEITRFDPEKKYGYISHDRFFHISQVCDAAPEDLLLRKLLAVGLGVGLQVSFCLGQNAKGPAADEVSLTTLGMQQADEAARQAGCAREPRKGFISQYSQQQELGTIQSGRESYRFRLSSVADPWLRAYCQESFSLTDPEVSFWLNGPYAADVCWLEPYPKERDYYQSSVTEAERRQWEEFRQQQAKKLAPIVLPAEDPYGQNFPYQCLPACTEAVRPVPVHPLQPPKAEHSFAGWGKKPALFHSISYGTSMPVGRIAEQARMAAVRGDLDRARSLFERAVEEEGFNDRVLMDLVTNSMRLNRGKDVALPLLERYQEQIAPEKLLDIRIQVYDKLKDHDALIPLYENSIQHTVNLSKRSHYLNRLTQIYLKQEKYKECLDRCDQWEQLYRQNQNSSDAEKLRGMIPVFRQRRALCLYHLGRKEEARGLAKDILRANPADTVAQGILNDTLSEDLNTVSPELFESESDLNLPGSGEGGSELDGIVRILLDQTDLQLKKSILAKVKDGRYCGSAQEGLRDAAALADEQRKIGSAPKVRSESLLAACKILDQLEQTNEIHKKLLQYAGRAMAYRGDYLVTQSEIPYETVRTDYLTAMQLLAPDEQVCVDACNRYLMSFFLARGGSAGSLGAYIAERSSPKQDRNDPVLAKELFAQNTILDALAPEFMVGLLQLFDVLRSTRQWELVQGLADGRPELRRLVLRELSAFVGKKLPDAIPKERLQKTFREASRIFREKINELNQCMSDLARVTTVSNLTTDAFGNTAEAIAGIEPDRWKRYLTNLDYNRLSTLYNELKRLPEFLQSNDFEVRSSGISGVHQQIKRLIQQIEQEPTVISFHIFRGSLQTLEDQLNALQNWLYMNFMPKLDWADAVEHPFSSPNSNKVQIQLNVTNRRSRQTAKDLKVTGVDVDGERARWEAAPVELLRGGETQEMTLILYLREEQLKNGSFTAEITYSFTCRESTAGTEILHSELLQRTFVLRNEDFADFTDPFGRYIAAPMKDEKMFMGRDEQLRQILRMLRPDSAAGMNYGRAIAIYGQTRTGKTSLMYHLKNRLRAECGDAVLIWDMGSLGDSLQAEEPQKDPFLPAFLYRMLNTGRRAMRGNALLKEELPRISPTRELLEKMLDHPEQALPLFTEYMDELNAALQEKRMIVVLMIDEFSYLHGCIRRGQLSDNFMHFWKALLQNYCIFAVIAGQDDMPEFMQEYPNDFACMELLKITYLDKESTIRLIRDSMQRNNPGRNGDRGIFQPEALERLYQLTDGSAYLSILLCSHLVEYMNHRGVQFVTRGIVEDFLRTSVLGHDSFLNQTYFEPQLQERGHDEYNEINKVILASVARHSQDVSHAATLEKIQEDVCRKGYEPGYAADCTERLKDRDVLYKNGQAGYAICVELLEKWLISMEGA